MLDDGDASFERTKALATSDKPLPETMFHKKVGDHEKLVCILNAFGQKIPEVYHVTVPNTGQVGNLARELCIECPVAFSRDVVEPVALPDLPLGIKANIDKAFLTTELVVDAALERDRTKFVQAIALDGWASSISQANALADELLAAHRQYLPGW